MNKKVKEWVKQPQKLQAAYQEVEDTWAGTLDWVDDNEFTFTLKDYREGDDISEVTEWIEDMAKEYGLKCDSSHDGHYVIWNPQ